ncbi:MAG: hypothetical protein LBP56_02170 [Odoribacteraceae bacterium]|jgi:hypothetical protein|nr:hypothetical protein [Odoribacteraceae bacterium]
MKQIDKKDRVLKRGVSLLLGLMTLLAAACERSGELPGRPLDTPVPGALPELDNGFRLELSVPGKSLLTYATVPSVGDEHVVNSLYLLFFEHDAKGKGQFIAHHEIPTAELTGVDFRNTKTLNIKFTNNSPLNKSTAYSILAIANVLSPGDGTKTVWGSSLADWLASFASFTEEEVINNSFESRSSGVSQQSDYTTALFTQGNLLMSARATREVGVSTVKLALNRLVSRFDVELHDTGYELQSVSIWNAYPEISLWERDSVDYSGMRLQRLYGKKATTPQALTGGLYAFENYVTSPVVNDNVTTCLIIGLTDGNKTYYYRQNINAYETPQQLKRNNVYRVSIHRVNAPGADSELEAYQSEEVLLETIINMWNMGQNGEMLYNGESVLLLPVSLVSFTAFAEKRDYKVHVQGAGTLSISNNTLPAGLSATLVGDLLTLEAAAGGAAPRGGYIEIAFGSLKGIINVNQAAAATKYIELTPPSIPLFAGNTGVASVPVRVNSSGPWTAELYNVTYAFAGPRPVFAFGLPTSTDITKSGTNDQTFTVSTTGQNSYTVGNPPEPTEIVSFLMIQLDADPTVRKVLMLTQKPVGGFTLEGQQKQLLFDASGAPLPGASNKELFTVKTSDPADTWSIALSGSDAAAFQVRDQWGHAPFASPHTGDGLFTIKASDNTRDKELSAVVTVTLGTQKFEIKLAQAKHVLSITPHAVAPLLATGGTTPDITVYSSATGKKWKATLVNATAQPASLSATTPAVTEITGQPLGGALTVTFPRLTLPFILPRATVTVQMEDYPWLTATVTASQQAYQPRVITMQTSHATYGRLDITGSSYNYFSAVGDALRDRHRYGPAETATTRTAANSLLSWPRNATVSNSSAIFLVNDGLNATQRNSVVAWRSIHPGNMLICLLDIGQGDTESLLRAIYGNTTLRIGDPRLTESDWNSKQRFAKPTNGGGSVAGRDRLWNYLVGGDAPFGAVDPDKVNLRPRHDMVDGTIFNAPSSLIPLLTVDGDIQLAIDPIKNLILIGNMDMFSAQAPHLFAENSDNWKFLHNLLAYIVNVAQCGELFLEQFQ